MDNIAHFDLDPMIHTKSINDFLPSKMQSLDEFWISLFEGTEHPSIRLAVILFAWHELVFIGRYIPYWICDYIPAAQKYRIQPV